MVMGEVSRVTFDFFRTRLANFCLVLSPKIGFSLILGISTDRCRRTHQGGRARRSGLGLDVGAASVLEPIRTGVAEKISVTPRKGTSATVVVSPLKRGTTTVTTSHGGATVRLRHYDLPSQSFKNNDLPDVLAPFGCDTTNECRKPGSKRDVGVISGRRRITGFDEFARLPVAVRQLNPL
jgi:hypothetical protein